MKTTPITVKIFKPIEMKSFQKLSDIGVAGGWSRYAAGAVLIRDRVLGI